MTYDSNIVFDCRKEQQQRQRGSNKLTVIQTNTLKLLSEQIEDFLGQFYALLIKKLLLKPGVNSTKIYNLFLLLGSSVCNIIKYAFIIKCQTLIAKRDKLFIFKENTVSPRFVRPFYLRFLCICN